MSLQVPANLSKPPLNVESEVSVRRTSIYHPSIWGDYFLSYASSTNSEEMDESMKQTAVEMKEQVRRMLKADTYHDKPLQKLELIDDIERLGVSYHFEAEIDEALHNMHKNFEFDDLYAVALYFRLLRQQGYYVSCDVFDKFKDRKGDFKESLASDVVGMLSLYEAAHLRVHGEDVLEEALAFTTTQLQSLRLDQLSPFLAAQVTHALKQPLHNGIPRLEARHYISIYRQDPSHNSVLLSFAILDFNLLQKMHQKELGYFTRWWNGLDFKTKLPFARDRVVECYFWIMSVYQEPQYVLSRKILTEVIALTSVIDDIYDNYGTIDELELFTDAIERWDIEALGQLPEYMQVCYSAVLDAYSEMEEEMASEGNLDRLYYAREAMKRTARAYFQEAKWFHRKHVPTIEEYLSVALVSSGYPLLMTISFAGMGDIVTKEILEWLQGMPRLVTASAAIARLMDDMVSSKFEQERGHVASSVECYMRQHGVTEEEVLEEFGKRVSDAWKDLNQECLHPNDVPLPLVRRILNFARFMDVVYKDGDGYTHADVFLKDLVAAVLVDSVPT